MSLKTSLGLSFIIASGMTAFFVIQVILAHPWLLLIPAVPVAGLAGWFLWSWAGVVNEKRLTLRAQRRASEIIPFTDGLGQQIVYHLNSGIYHNLTTDPRFAINGHATEPTQAELAMQALFFQAVGKGHTERPGPVLPLLPAPEADLMTELRTAQRVLIKAASDGGKTTLLQHIAAQRVTTESVLIIDSQSYPDKWPTGCKVVGTGSNHQAISVALDGLIDLMVKRYQEIGAGLVREGQHPKLTIIIDEWMAIVSECANASDVIRRLLTESRKAAFSVFVGSHSERVKSLGLDGRGDLRDGFLIVRIEVENGQRKATIDTGKGERPCILPGPFVASQPGNVFEIEAIEIPQATDEEQQVLRMINDGESFRAISQAVWGQRGTFYNARIESIAKKFGCEVRNGARND